MNKHLTPEKSKLFRNKLEKLLESIYRSRASSDLQTQEAYVLEAVKILSLYYRNITESNFTVRPVIPGTWPSLEDYNNNFNEILDDLLILYAELENLEGVTLEHFNLVAAHSNRLNARIKRLSSDVTDFALYSNLPIKNALFFSDTFSDLSKVEVDSELLNANECDVSQVEGIVTLPVDRAATSTLAVTSTPLINSNSNGRTGNNEQVGVTQVNNNMLVILDNNPDTWFEYERVVKLDDGEALNLDFTMNLSENSIINYIRVNPNNFGTKTEIEILDISTSADGEIYLSIKDDIPIAGFTIEDEANVFKLAPSTSKYAGQGIYTFTPRYAKYIRIVLRQSTPYPIQTVQGTQFRYAIGLRDIEVQQQAYEPAGEIVSVPFSSTEEIKKVTIQTNQTPVGTSELANISHQISVDEGNSWHAIVPLADDPELNIASEVEEILNINTEDSNSLTTENPVTSIRYKAVLSRDTESFNDGSTSFAQAIVPFSELKPIPQGDPQSLELTNSPVVGSLTILDPSYGSRGNNLFKYVVGSGDSFPITIPWSSLPPDLSKSGGGIVENEITSVFVDGVEWQRRPDFFSSGPEDTHFKLSPGRIPGSGLLVEDGKAVGANLPMRLEFGNGNNGRKPDPNATIEILFTPERLYPVGKDEHIATLEFATSLDKADVVVTRYGEIEAATADLSKNSNIHRLPNTYLEDPASFKFAGSGLLEANRKTFANGLATPEGELLDPGDWSVDLERGIIYTFDMLGETPGTVSYTYQAQENLSSTQWDWGDDSSTPRSIKILNDGWITNTGSAEITTSGLTTKSLSHLAIAEGTVEFTVPADVAEEDNPFLEEVPFSGVPGQPELSTVIKTEEPIPTTNPVGNIATFSTSAFISDQTNLSVGFDDTVTFATDLTPAAPTAPGEYSIDRAANTISVWTAGADLEDVGKVYYYAEDPSRVAQGAYAIDYKRGLIYMQRPSPFSIGNITIKYQYSNYRARYNITREVPEYTGSSRNWQLDPATKTVTIYPSEMFFRLSVSNLSSQSFKPSMYQLNYNYIGTVRQDIADLEPYFSPVLKDYALKVVTKDNV